MVTQLFNQEHPSADAMTSPADCALVGDLVRIAEEGGTFDLNRCGCERCIATIADAVVNANFVAKLQHDAPAPLESDSVPNVRIRLDPPLGSGGQGAVFFGVDPQTADCVAVKILSRGQCGSVESVSRVFHEAMWLKQLAAPGLAELDRCGVTRNRLPFLSTRYVEGPTLRDVIQDRRRMRITRADRAAWALRVVSEILGTVSRMHERGIVHRDLKPANILMRHGRDPVLLDLGIAVSTSAERAADSATRFSGTISYAAPERLRLGDQACDAAVDVFSLGVMLRELAGLDGLREHGPADRMSPAMRELIAKATDDDASQRFANAGEMLAAVDMVRASYERASGGKTRRTIVLATVFTLVAVTSVLATLWLSSRPDAKLAIREERSAGSPRLPAVPPGLPAYGPREQLVEMRNSWAAGEAAVPEFDLASRSLEQAKLYFGSIEPLGEWGYLAGDTVDGQVTAVATNPLELVYRSGRSKMVFVEPVGRTSRSLEWREEVLPRCGFSPNGNWVITFGLGRNFAVFDRRTLTQQFSGTLHSRSHEAPNISDDGEYISQVDRSGVIWTMRRNGDWTRVSSADADHSESVFCGPRLLIANSRGQVICYDPLTQSSSRAQVSKEQSQPFRLSSNERWAMVTFASGLSSYTRDWGATWTIVEPYTQLRDSVALGVDPGQAVVFSQGIGRDVGGGLSRALQSGFTRVIHAAMGDDNSVLVTHGRTWRLINSTLASGWKRVSMGLASDMFVQRIGDDYLLAGEHGVWRLPIGTESLRCLFPESTANVAIDSSSDRLLVGGYGGKVASVGASNGERRWEFQRADVGTAMVALGSHVAFVGGTDGSVTALDAESGRELWMRLDHRRRVRGMSVVADRVVTASASPGLLVYDIAGKLVGRCGIAEARCVALASDAHTYFCGTDRGTVASGDTSARIPRGEVPAHSGGVWSVAVNAAGTIGASGGGDGIVRLWWLDPLTPLAKFEISSDSASLVCDIHFSDDSRKLMCTVNDHGAYEIDLSRHERALEDWLTKDRYFTFSGDRDQTTDVESRDGDAGDQ